MFLPSIVSLPCIVNSTSSSSAAFRHSTAGVLLPSPWIFWKSRFLNFISAPCGEREGSSTPQCGWRAWRSCLSFCPPNTFLMAAAISPDIPVFFPVRDLPAASVTVCLQELFRWCSSGFRWTFQTPRLPWIVQSECWGGQGLMANRPRPSLPVGEQDQAFQLWTARLYWT